jgi:hypothetical protein
MTINFKTKGEVNITQISPEINKKQVSIYSFIQSKKYKLTLHLSYQNYSSFLLMWTIDILILIVALIVSSKRWLKAMIIHTQTNYFILRMHSCLTIWQIIAAVIINIIIINKTLRTLVTLEKYISHISKTVLKLHNMNENPSKIGANLKNSDMKSSISIIYPCLLK